jgi:hypothetical protein
MKSKQERLQAKIERMKAMLSGLSGVQAKQVEAAIERAERQLKEAPPK